MASPVGELDPESSAAEQSREEELSTQHEECELDQCLICKILTLGLWFIPIADRAEPEP
jgi:hypothetical protein